MVDRVEEEYELADRIRVYSEWRKQSMLRFGVPEDKIHILRQTVNVEYFRPRAERLPHQGALQVWDAGRLDLRKGFVYLLQAIRAVGAQKIQLRIVGATVTGHAPSCWRAKAPDCKSKLRRAIRSQSARIPNCSWSPRSKMVCDLFCWKDWHAACQ
jgi:glycosyltransferase involved in cell wall biosynthesis